MLIAKSLDLSNSWPTDITLVLMPCAENVGCMLVQVDGARRASGSQQAAARTHAHHLPCEVLLN